MSARPWIKFYPRDWRGDQALRAVSMAARGFWLECLCIMHEAQPYGHLLLNGEPLEGGALARMTGASADEVSAWIAELRKAGVLSVARNGVIISRRMVKDNAASIKGRKEAERRWSQATQNKQEKAEPIGEPKPLPIAQKPEARKKTSCDGGKIEVIEEQFSRFRQAYPRREGADPRAPALKRFSAMVKAGADPEAIIAGAVAFAAAEGKRGKIGSPYIPHSASWLNRRGWEDALEQPAAPAVLVGDQEDRWRRMLDAHAQGNWPGVWGDPPGHPGCKIPRAFIEANRQTQRAA